MCHVRIVGEELSETRGCTIQMEVMGLPVISGRLHLTSALCVVKAERKRGLHLQRDPYFATKAHLQL